MTTSTAVKCLSETVCSREDIAVTSESSGTGKLAPAKTSVCLEVQTYESVVGCSVVG